MMEFKSCDPNQRGNASRISNRKWSRHKDLLKRLHSEGYTRRQMLKELNRRGFYPNFGQLNSKMMAWGFRKYGLNSEVNSQAVSSMVESHDTGIAGCSVANATGQVSFVDCQPEVHTIGKPSSLAPHEKLRTSLDLRGVNPWSEELSRCLLAALQDWMQEKQRQHPALTHADLIKVSNRTDELQALLKLARVSGYAQTACNLSMVLLYVCAHVPHLGLAELSDCLVWCHLTMVTSKWYIWTMNQVFDAAKKYYSHAGLHGVADCMQREQALDFHVEDLDLRQRLALYVVDESPLKQEQFRPKEYYESLSIGLRQERHCCSGSSLSPIAVEFATIVDAILSLRPENRLGGQGAAQLDALVESLLKSNPDRTKTNVKDSFATPVTVCSDPLCRHKSLSSTALGVLLLSRHMSSYTCTWDWSKGPIERIRTAAVESFNQQGCEAALLDCWIKVPHLVNDLKQDLVVDYLLIPQISMQQAGAITWNQINQTVTRPGWTDNDDALYRQVIEAALLRVAIPQETAPRFVASSELIIDTEVAGIEKDTEAVSPQAETLTTPFDAFVTPTGTMILPDDEPEQVKAIKSFAHPSSSVRSRGSKSIVSASHSSWSFHRLTGYPKISSSVASELRKGMEDFEKSEALHWEAQKNVSPNVDHSLIADLSEAAKTDQYGTTLEMIDPIYF